MQSALVITLLYDVCVFKTV